MEVGSMRRGGEDEMQGFHQEEARDGVVNEDGNNYMVFVADGEGEEDDGYGQIGEEEEEEEEKEEEDAARMGPGEANYGREEYRAGDDELMGVGGQKGTWGNSHDQVLAWDFGDAAADRDGEAVLENCGGPEAIGEDEGACAIIDEARVFKSDTSNGVPLMDRVMIEALESVEELRKGSCLLFNHGVYKGGLKKLRPHGRGRATWPDGEEYKGQWWMGDPEGHGKMVFPTGESYTGDWSCGQRSGHGEWVSASGTLVYEGGFDGGRFHGFGRLADAESGLAYEGGFEEGTRHGTGRILDASTEEEVAPYAVFDRDEPRGQRPPQRMVDSNVGMRRGGRDGRLYYYGEVGEGGEGADGLGAEVDEVQGKVVFSGQSFEGARHGLGMRLEIKEREYSGWFAFGEQSGHGVDVCEDGDYAGLQHAGARHGYGELARGGVKFGGWWRMGVKEGWGKWTVKNAVYAEKKKLLARRAHLIGYEDVKRPLRTRAGKELGGMLYPVSGYTPASKRQAVDEAHFVAGHAAAKLGEEAAIVGLRAAQEAAVSSGAPDEHVGWITELLNRLDPPPEPPKGLVSRVLGDIGGVVRRLQSPRKPV